MPSYTFKKGEDIRLPADSAAATAVAYLTATENNELETAQALLADDFLMTFPDDKIFTTLDDFVSWAISRFNGINKTYERFDELNLPDHSVVYCMGTLSGELSDGTTFKDIRFIDRFTTTCGKIIDQKVWNDLDAEK